MIHHVIRLSRLIRRTIYAPLHSKPRGGMRMFLPRERQLPSPVCPSVRRILRHLCCFIMLCYVVEAQGPPHRNQEPHKLLCDSQNASHSHLTCGIKLSQPMMRGGFKKEWWWNWNSLCPFHFLVCTRTIGVISRSCCFDWENARHSWHPRVILNNTHTRVSHAFVF